MQFKKLLVSYASFIFMVFSLQIFADTVEIAKEGKPQMKIVLDANAPIEEKNAASELKKYLDKITGCKFEIVDKFDGTTKAIYVGQGKYLENICKDIDLKVLGTDGIVIRTVDGNLILTGGRPRGVVYSVYAFLQDYLGCRWYAPDEEKIPFQKNLSVEDINSQYVPLFEFREYYSIGMADPIFAAKNFLNGRDFFTTNIPQEFGGSVTMGGAHTLAKIFVKPDKYFTTHPEWFAWRKQEKKREKSQLCMTNTELQQQVLKDVLEYLGAKYAEMPAQNKIVSVSCDDTDKFCQCEKCMEISSQQGTPAAPLVALVNFVAKGVKEKYHDVTITTLAYWHTDMPPLDMKCRDNVMVQIGTLDRNHFQPVGKTNFAKIIEGWKKAARNIYIWDYDANFSNFIQPHPNHNVTDESIKYYQGNGIKGIFVQGPWGQGAELYAMRAWVHAQMLWDPRRDYNKLTREFCTAYYGAAGKYILQYIYFLKNIMLRGTYFLGCYSTTTDKWLTLDDLNTVTRIFDTALKAVEGDKILTQRVRLAKLSVDIVWLQRYYELRQESQSTGKPFLGPENPYAEMDKLEKNEFNINGYNEVESYHQYLQLLRKQFPAKTSALPAKYGQLKPWQWVEIQEIFFNCKNGKIEKDVAASNQQALIVRQPGKADNIIYTIPKEFSGRYRVLLVCRAIPQKDYKDVDFPICIYYRPYPSAGITEVARQTVNFNRGNCNEYKVVDMGVQNLGEGTEIQIQPCGAGHFGKADAVYIDRMMLLICEQLNPR